MRRGDISSSLNCALFYSETFEALSASDQHAILDFLRTL